MNELIRFGFEDKQLRIIMDGSEPLFVAKDACEILEHSNTAMALKGLDEDEKGVRKVYTPGGDQELAVVSEPGLYKLILRSHKPQAKPFQRLVSHEILPSIRKHGAYMTPQKIEEVLLNPDTIIQLATNLKREQEARRQLEEQIKADKPKLVFAEALQTSNASILVGELAKLLKQNGINIGQNRLFELLRNDGYLMKTKGERWNDPTQRSMDLGLFEIKKRSINNPDGSVLVTKTTKVTVKGQMYFINKFKNELSTSSEVAVTLE